MAPVPGHPLAADLEHILRVGEAFWPRLRGERLFITGGTGFFGIWLLEALTWANDRLDLNLHATVLTRNPDAFARRAPRLASHACLAFHRGDIRDFSFPDGSFAHVIHAATDTDKHANLAHPLQMLDVILGGTRRTIEFALRCKARNFLLTSSGAVYGRQPPGLPLVPEDYCGGPAPDSYLYAYATGKRAAESLCGAAYQECGLPAKIARCFAFVGPHLQFDAHFALGNFLGDALAGRDIVVKGDGTAVRSYLYGADLVVWLLKILLDGAPNHPYNVGSDRAIDIEALARLVAEASPGHPAVKILKPRGCEAVDHYVPDISRARSELGLDVFLPLDAAIGRTLDWGRTTSGWI